VAEASIVISHFIVITNDHIGTAGPRESGGGPLLNL
jgi:hypothetical protein